MHLKSRYGIQCAAVFNARFDHTVTIGAECSLNKSDRSRLFVKLLPVVGQRVVVVPGANALLIKLVPGEARAGIIFSVEGNIRVPYNGGRVNVGVARQDVFCQFNDHFNLFGVIVGEKTKAIVAMLSQRGTELTITLASRYINNFNTNGMVVQTSTALPVTLTGMPCALIFIDQLNDPRITHRI